MTIKEVEKKSIIATMADRFGMEAAAFEATVRNTVMPTGNNVPAVTNEQFAAFLLVAKEYNLNPITKEVYAFPARSGGIQPVVSIDGWLNIINSHPEFDGMKFEDSLENDKLVSVTCRIYRKDRSHPTEVTEYMSECKGTSEPWRKWPARMLRHKATIQAARYAFGFSGIADPDEAERMASVDVIDIPKEPELYNQERFEKNMPVWRGMIESGKKSSGDIIAMIESKFTMEEHQKNTLNNVIAVTEAEVVEDENT